MWRGIVPLLASFACGRIGFEPVNGDGGRPGGDGSTACQALAATWTPRWSNIIEYEPFDGAGAIADGASLPAAIGEAGSASNLDQSGMRYVQGKVAQAISFDGNDDYLVLSVPAVDSSPGQATSVAFWMRWNGIYYPGNSGSWTCVIVFQATYDLAFVAYDVPTTSFGFNTGNGDLWGIGPGGLASGWVHVVAVFGNGPSDGSLLYIDGQAQTMAQTLGTPHLANATSTMIVAGYASYPSFYAGALDELAVWNVALGAEDVATLYAGQAACP
ncbi:MAG TPA: LamG domain-containing protein [Kofleriaceae bacterium]|nr:LamG domain-containing protein [Kofleriaceae bacterium]